MERAMIAWNVPNIITIWLMAAIGFLVVGVISQLLLKGVASAKSGVNDGNNAVGGY